MRRYQRDELLTASEIARYVYCQRAWSYDRLTAQPHRRRILLAAAFGLVLIAALVTVALVVGT